MKKDRLFWKFRETYDEAVRNLTITFPDKLNIKYIEHNTKKGNSVKSSSGYVVEISTREEDMFYIFLHEYFHCLDDALPNNEYNMQEAGVLLREYVADLCAIQACEYMAKPIMFKDNILNNRMNHALAKLRTNANALQKADNRAKELLLYFYENNEEMKNFFINKRL